MIDPAYTEVGFGVFDTTGQSQYGRYWVQHLGSGSSEEGIYLPSNCGGITTADVPDAAPASATAGRSNRLASSQKSIEESTLPKKVFSEQALSLPGNGTIPVGSLAFAVAGEIRKGKTEIPEPAMLLGLAGLGVAIWRDRKVAAKKRSADVASD